MSERKKDPMLVNFEDITEGNPWKKCLEELKKNYTVSIREACKILMCDRSWIQRYVRPNVHYIYLSKGFGKNKINYVQMASKHVERDLQESNWLNTKEFEQLIRGNLYHCTRQTIAVPIEALLKREQIELFQSCYRELERNIETYFQEENYEAVSHQRKQKEQLICRFLSLTGLLIYDNRALKNKRTLTEAVPCQIPEFDFSELIAAHDMKSYGDTDEEIYRRLFEMGCYRMELILKDKNGHKSKKVYYLKQKETFPKWENSVGTVLIGYSDYLKYRDLFEKK